MAARRGIRSITGLASGGGSVNVPTPNPPTPPVTPPSTRQSLAMAVAVMTPTVFAATVTRSSTSQNAVVPVLANPQTVHTPRVTALPITETFTGANGTQPGSNWGTAVVSSGASLQINSNQLLMTGGTLGSYNDWQYLPGTFNLTDFEATFDCVLGTISETFFQFGFRGSGTQESIAGHRSKQTSGYFVEIAPFTDTVLVGYRAGGTQAQVGAGYFPNFISGDTIHCRVRCVGTSIKVRVWQNAASEPLSWHIDTTHESLTSGRYWLGNNGGGDAVSDTARWDNVTINYVAPSGSGSYLDPPTTEAISGMNTTPDKEWDWTGVSPLSDWYLHDGAASNKNGERSAPRPANATIVTGEAGTTGNAYLRLIVRRETYSGLPLSGVQMEASGFRYGAGAAFYAEVRLRWTGYLGFWGGPWILAYPGIEYEIDLMETINSVGPLMTMHSPEYPSTAYTASNDGGWHRYGLRVDTTGFKMFFDNALVLSVTNSTIGNAFVTASMFPKIQHLCGGNFPNSNNGSTIPDGSLPTTDKYFDVDYYRFYN